MPRSRNSWSEYEQRDPAPEFDFERSGVWDGHHFVIEPATYQRANQAEMRLERAALQPTGSTREDRRRLCVVI